MNFSEWFVLQHGQRPSTKSLTELGQEVGRTKAEAAKAEQAYRAVLEWEGRRTSALYAWCVKERA